MCQNRGNKVSYKKLEDVEFKAAIQGTSYSFAAVATSLTPYTLAISRKVTAPEPAHVYCRIESAAPFVVNPIAERSLSELFHVAASGVLNPGAADGVLKSCPQWRLAVHGPARLFLRTASRGARVQHSFFVGVPTAPGRFSKPSKFYYEVRLHPDSPFEVDFVDIRGDWDFVVVGVTRVKHAAPSECVFDLWCGAQLGLEAMKPITDDGPLMQASRMVTQAPPPPRPARGGGNPSRRARGGAKPSFEGVAVGRLYKMMEDL
jgi:hypothetical protein